MGKRCQQFFNSSEERGDDGRIFKAKPSKGNHLKKSYKLHDHMCVIYSIKEPKLKITIKKSEAKDILTYNSEWRYHKKG